MLNTINKNINRLKIRFKFNFVSEQVPYTL